MFIKRSDGKINAVLPSLSEVVDFDNAKIAAEKNISAPEKEEKVNVEQDKKGQSNVS